MLPPTSADGRWRSVHSTSGFTNSTLSFHEFGFNTGFSGECLVGKFRHEWSRDHGCIRMLGMKL